MVGGSVYGGIGGASAASNDIRVTGGTVEGSVFGGSGINSAFSNDVTIAGGTLRNVFGGQATGINGEARHNTITISHGTVGNVFGGQAAGINGTARHNKIRVSGGTVESVFGGSGANAISNDVAIISSGAVWGTVFGGLAGGDIGEANYNKVTVSNTGAVSEDIFGGYSISASADFNTVNISGSGRVTGSVYGGYSASASAAGNDITISGGTAGNVFGGAGINSVFSNDVTIAGGTLRNVFGGQAAGISGEARHNTITISNGAVESVFGGQATGITGTARHNKILINNGTVGSVFGGSAVNSAFGNDVTIDGGMMGKVYGGLAAGVTGAANDNTVTFNGGTVSEDVFGGSGANTISNDVTVGGAVWGTVYGGLAAGGAGEANENPVTVSGGAVSKDVYGGFTANASAGFNTVEIGGSGTVEGSVYGGIGAYAVSNDVTVGTGAGGEVWGTVYGGYSGGNDVSAGDGAGDMYGGRAAGNDVTVVSDGTVLGAVYGGYSAGNDVRVSGGMTVGDVYGGYAAGNDVSIEGNVTGDVYGGYAAKNYILITGDTGYEVSGDVYGGYAANNTVSGAASGNYFDDYAGGNSIIISGDMKFTKDGGHIYGGFVSSGDATGNTLTISGNPTMDKMTLAGGGKTAGTGDVFTDNTLNLNNNTPNKLTVAGLKNFENLNFHLPDNLRKNDKILTIARNGTADLTDPNDPGRSSNIVVDNDFLHFDGNSESLKNGDWIALIDASSAGADLMIGGGANIDAPDKAKQGVTLEYDVYPDIDRQNNRLRLVITGVEADEQSEALPESYLSGVTLANRGVDLLAGPLLLKQGGNGVFAIADGAASRYDTADSRLYANDFTLLTGVSKAKAFRAGTLTLKGFFVHGSGSYDTYNAGAPDTDGSGNAEYSGGGAFARFDFKGSAKGRPYIEAHAQGGWIENDFFSADFTGAMGRAVKYEASSHYFGGHIGAGYIKNFGGGGELDIYAKYLHARRSGSSVKLNTGDPIVFDAIKSSRLRIGGRYTWGPKQPEGEKKLRPYAGVAYEYEFDGKANATAYGYPINAPSLSGGTGIFELGFRTKLLEDAPLYLELGGQFYTGARDGASVNLTLEWLF
jgi:hypothetical protein